MRRRLLIVLTGLALALAAAGVAVALGGGKESFVHRGGPVFNGLYDAEAVDRLAPRPGELLRLRGRTRPGLRAEVSVRRLALPPYRGDVAGAFPLYADGHIRALRARFGGFDLLDEGKTRVSKAPGYQVGFRAGRPGARLEGRDLLAVAESGQREGVIIALRQSRSRPLVERDRDDLKAVRSAFRSLAFGTGRP